MSDKRTDFPRAEAAIDIPALETEILELWDRTDAFSQQVELRPADNEYIFYDGPPFPTGSPHYGNLLAGVIKDVVPRYWAMRGYRVERRFGWDTHVRRRPRTGGGSRAGSGAGSISTTTTRRWTPTSWNRCGGSSSSSGTRA